MNFGESLAYWYLRLNGFLPMTNFVLHGQGRRRQTADADILAVRFPHVFEEVGGQPGDWDNERFDGWQLGHRLNIVCLVCEVKTGSYKKSTINTAFDTRRLQSAIERFGIVRRDTSEAVAARLRDHAVVPDAVPEIVFAKLLIDDDTKRPSNNAENGLAMRACCRLTLREALSFIRERMTDYRDAKNAGRMFFPGDLPQLLAWEAGVNVVVENEELDEPEE